MRNLFTLFAAFRSRSATLLVMLLFPLLGWGQSTTVVISQVYGGGGNSGATYQNDFIELHNISSVSQPLTGFSIQYNSATSTTTAWLVTSLSGIIPAGGYFLVKEASSGAVGLALPTADVTGTINLSGTAGKVALVNNATAFTTQCPAGTIDLVGFGTTANCNEGGANTPAPSNTTAALRKANGCTDTNNNGNDFTAVTPTPRNAASPVFSCTSPIITVSAADLTAFATTEGTASAFQNYTVSGSNLTANITITPPTGYELALESATPGTPGTFSSSPITLTQASGSVASAKIYARLTATATAAGSPYNGNIGHASTGAGTVNKAVNGTVTAPTAPVITATGTPAAFNTLAGTPSAFQTFNVSGTNLTAGITITPPTGYEASLDAGATYSAAAQTLGAAGTVASTSVRVRLTGATPTASLGTALLIRSSGAPDQDKTLSGTVVPEPTAIPTVTVVPGFSAAVVTVTAPASNGGTRRLVVVRLATAAAVPPTDATAYTANAAFGTTTGTNPTTGTGNFVVFNAGSSPGTVTVSGLAVNTSYVADAYEYNNSASAGFENYYTTAGSTAFSTTVNPLVAYDFVGSGTSGSGDPAPAYPAANASVTAIPFARAVVAVNAGADRFNSSGFPTSTTADLTKYVGFTFTIASGQQAALSFLTFTDQRSANGPNSYEVRGSADGFATSVVLATGATAGSAKSIDLSVLTNVQGTYGIRFYGFNAVTTGGTYSVDAVYLYGTVSSIPPMLTVTPGTLNPFFALAGSVSASQSYPLTGVNVSTSTPIAITAPTGFEVSLDGGTTYAGGTQSFTPATASFTKTVAVRLSATATGTPSGNITNTNGTEAATVAVTGTVVAEPTTQPTVAATSPTTTTVQLSLSGGGGTKRLVVVRPVAATAGAPADGTAYTANLAYGTTTGTNPTTGPNNFVVVADGSSTSVTITGLTANTAYTVEAYAYNEATVAGFGNYLAANPGTASFTTLSAGVVTYIWNGLVDANWTTAGNWTPARLLPASNDILLFDGAVTPTPTLNANFTTGETVGQLRFENNVTATLTTDANRTLTIDGNATGDDFVVASGSTATIGTSATAAGLVFNLTASATGSIGGTLVFDGVAGAFGQHSLQAAAANAVQFLSGSIFRTMTFYDGGAAISPFGAATGNANSVVFRNGSRYEQFGGSNPFGLVSPNTAVTFEPTSRFVFEKTINAPALSGRTYGTLEYNTTSSAVGNSTGASLLTILGDLIITNGTVGLDLTTAGISLKGNVLVNGGSLAFNPTATGGTVQFNGTTAQTIGGTAAALALTFGPNSSVTVNNPAGVTLQRPITLQKGFTLTDGLVTTDATNLLTLGPNAVVSGGSATSYVNGPLARETAAGIASVTNFVFPLGKSGFFRAFTLALATQTAASTYTAEQLEGNPDPSGTNLLPGNGLGTASLKRMSRFRSFTFTSSNTTNFNAVGTVTLSFGLSDRVNDPSDLGLVVAVSTGASPFGNLDRSASTGVATGAGGADVVGTVTSKPLYTASATAVFALGATNDNTVFGQPLNPLPVQLTSFSARRQADNAVVVKWNTASEKNSARFEVQRSLNGREYTTVATATARGNSTQATTYAVLDKTTPAASLYYRLRQVDQDGSFRFSPVVTVAGIGQLAKVLLYPNPTTSSLHFLTEAALPYRVLNQLGQPVLHGTTETGEATVPTETLKTGLYFLELQTGTGSVVQKFEKQ